MDSKDKPEKKNNTTVIIIIVAVVIVGIMLIGLGVGGWYAYKHWFKKNTETNTTSTPTTLSTSELTVSQLESMITYPNGILISTDHSKANGSTSSLEMETDDAVSTVYNHYLNLNSNGKWTVVSKSLSAEQDRATVSYLGQNSEFTIDFVIVTTSAEKTWITADITAEGLTMGTIAPTTTSSVNPKTSSSASSDTSKKNISNEYIIADSNNRVISESELTNLTPWELKVARNEIYARHGRSFVHKDLQCYFSNKSWYSENTNFSESSLSTTENKNVAIIKSYEEKINSPLANKDTGC